MKLRRVSTFYKDTATCFRNWKDGFIVAENLLAFVGCCFPIWLVWYTYKVYIQKCFGCRHKKNLHVQGIFYHQMLNSSHSQNNRSRFVFLIFFHQIYTCISKKKTPKKQQIIIYNYIIYNSVQNNRCMVIRQWQIKKKSFFLFDMKGTENSLQKKLRKQIIGYMPAVQSNFFMEILYRKFKNLHNHRRIICTL